MELKNAKVPAELHIYASGGHGYGLRRTELPITEWPKLAETWLHTIHILGASAPSISASGYQDWLTRSTIIATDRCAASAAPSCQPMMWLQWSPAK